MNNRYIIVMALMSFCITPMGFAKSTNTPKVVQQTTKLPFIGTRFYTFEFWGSSGGEKITIKKNGDTTITYYNEIAVMPIYKGKYTDPIVTKLDGQITRYKIIGNKIMQVDSKGNVETGCMGRDGNELPCVTQLEIGGL